MKEKKHSHTTTVVMTTTALVLAAILLLVPVVMTSQQQQAFAAGASGTLDPNGILRKDPIAGYTMAFGSEFYIGNAVKNFRADGSERIDFKGKETDSLLIAGYFNVVKGDANNANWCVENAGNPGEEISSKINGGPHNDVNPQYADTADFGVINAEGTQSRLRFEIDHPDYEPATAPTTQPGLPLQNDLCSVPGGWTGIMTEKINQDTNCDGIIDRIFVANYVDESGLNPTTGKPQNNWELVWYKQFTLSQWLTKGKVQSYVENIEQPSLRYQTIRIDNQDQASWLNTADPPYKFVTLKEIINVKKDACPTPPIADQYDVGYPPPPEPEPEPTPTNDGGVALVMHANWLSNSEFDQIAQGNLDGNDQIRYRVTDYPNGYDQSRVNYLFQNYRDKIPGLKVGISVAYSDIIVNNAAEFKELGFDFVEYNLETDFDGPNSDDQADENVAKVKAAADACEAQGLEFRVTPGRPNSNSFLRTNTIDDIAREVDFYHIQAQSIQETPSAYADFTEDVTTALRAANPDILSTSQVSPGQDSAAGKTIQETMRDAITAAMSKPEPGNTDGAGLWIGGDDVNEAASFFEWFATTAATSNNTTATTAAAQEEAVNTTEAAATPTTAEEETNTTTTTTTTEEDGDGLAQEQDPQSEDNNDTTTDDDRSEDGEEQEEEEQQEESSRPNNRNPEIEEEEED